LTAVNFLLAADDYRVELIETGYVELIETG
jgi:hypothetical protein